MGPSNREPPPENASVVRVPVPVLAALVAGLLGMSLLTAWLLGRESGRRIAESARVAAPAAPVGGAEPAPAQTPAPVRGLPTPVPAAPAPPPFPAATAPPGAPPAALQGLPTAPGSGSTEAPAVQRYLAELEGLTAGAAGFGDPQQLAMSLVGELTRGDSSGLDRLMQTQAEVEQKMRAMNVPAPCRAHHQRSLQLLAQARSLLQRIGRAAVAGDVGGVAGAAAEAQSMAAAAREVEAMEGELRARYGAPSPSY